MHHIDVSKASFYRSIPFRNNVVLTSMRHHYVASTSVWHHFDVMCPLDGVQKIENCRVGVLSVHLHKQIGADTPENKQILSVSSNYILLLFFILPRKYPKALHGPRMLVDEINSGLVIYKHANFYRFEETYSYWSVKRISVFLCFSLVN